MTLPLKTITRWVQLPELTYQQARTLLKRGYTLKLTLTPAEVKEVLKEHADLFGFEVTSLTVTADHGAEMEVKAVLTVQDVDPNRYQQGDGPVRTVNGVPT
jgi:hypothetical protein